MQSSKVFITSLFLSVLMIFFSCNEDEITAEMIEEPSTPLSFPDAIPATLQKSGDANAGWDFLRFGNYVGSGLPLEVYTSFFPADTENLLGRDGDNATLPPSFVAFSIGDKRVVGGTCFTCHGSKLDGEYIPGLGNSFSDYTNDQSQTFGLLNTLLINTYGAESEEYQNAIGLIQSTQAAGPFIITDFKGVNPAFDLERAAVAHRNLDFTWSETPLFTPPSGSVGSDVPAWWLLKKKNALYYTGLGRGDFTKLLMQTTVVGIKDSTEARVINDSFNDVLAYLQSLEAPKYTRSVNQELVTKGLPIYKVNCERCHGSYEAEDAFYPNRLIETNIVGTDPVYADRFLIDNELTDWFNNGWFGTFGTNASVEPSRAYIAPPLDGVWATAPYLHNGSVPNLYTLLNSTERPVFWERNFNDSTYDHEKIGWPYQERTSANNISTYNTTLSGYGNQGHIYGDNLSEEDRIALMEYLKTL